MRRRIAVKPAGEPWDGISWRPIELDVDQTSRPELVLRGSMDELYELALLLEMPIRSLGVDRTRTKYLFQKRRAR